MLKAAIKQSSSDQIRHRIIPGPAVTAMSSQLDELKDEIQEILKEEREEKMVSRWRRTTLIFSCDKRTWS
jgi:ATP-dependent RNA helicase DDX27